MSYKHINAEVNSKPYPAVQVNLNGEWITYIDWVVAKDLGLNITKAVFGDVEINNKRPNQVTDPSTTYIQWDQFGVKFNDTPLSGGGFNFTTETHDYNMTVDQPSEQIINLFAPIGVLTFDGKTPLGKQIISIKDSTGTQLTKNYTDSNGQLTWRISEGTDKTDTITVEWTDPEGKLHTSTNSTSFYTPKVTDTPLPSDDNKVAQFPLTPSSDIMNAILFEAENANGDKTTFQLDTGAFELMLTENDAKLFNAQNLGDTSVQGVGGGSKAYYSIVDVVINGVKFEKITCVVDPSFTDYSLFGYKFFIDNKYDLLISQKHNDVTILK